MDRRQIVESAALAYQEPSIVTILTQSSFLLLLNGLNHVMNKVLYCGLIGQILLGVAYGSPSLDPLLSNEAQQVMVQLGFLGLLLLVFEGGLSTDIGQLKANLWLSAGIAITGIVMPVGLSFILMALANASPLQAFSAGAALCSTSLGTTFTVLGSTGLINTRMGVVLSSAAMMDDVVGLVMVQVVDNLGGSNSSVSAVTIVRPVLVSVAFATMVPLVVRLSLKPLASVVRFLQDMPYSWSTRLTASPSASLVLDTLLLLGLVAGSSYAGTSNLFAAYIAGASISWLDNHLQLDRPRDVPDTTNTPTAHDTPSIPPKNHNGLELFRTYYAPALNRILKPFFFASIGFSIPISRMFKGSIVWRGIIYTLLMILGKAFCGLWLVRLSSHDSSKAEPDLDAKRTSVLSWLMTCLQSVVSPHLRRKSTRASPTSKPARPATSQELAQAGCSTPQADLGAAKPLHLERDSAPPLPSPKATIKKPISLYPAAILSAAMVSRGEIGFLISAVAESNGTFTSTSGDDEIFLIVTWAIMLCTIIGPVVVGTLVRRVRRLEAGKSEAQGPDVTGRDVLGIWGVQ